MVSFEIDLREFNLGDVLQFLCRIKKTGVLRVKGQVSGEIWVKEGFVVHATDSSEQGIDALFNLSFIELDKGSFESELKSPAQTISQDIGKLSEDIEKRRTEFSEIKKSLPPMDTVLMKSTKDLESAVALRRTDWQILALIDGERKLGDVVVGSKLGGYEATKTIVWLKEQGLIYDPEEAARIMSGLIGYFTLLFEVFGKNGLTWIKDWSTRADRNKKIIDAIDIDEENFKVKPKGELPTDEINFFMDNFDEYLKKEGPKIYGKLLFKKKYQEFSSKQ